MRIAFLLLLFLLFSVPAMAGEFKGTQVSLSAQAEQMLPNDEVVVQFRIEADGPKADVLRRKVNHISHAVDARLQRQKHLVQETTGRRIDPIWHYDNDTNKRIRDGWRLVQSERVTSTDLDAVPDWVDAIERAGAHLGSLSFRVSHRAMAVARQRLRMQAIARFRRRAAETAKALGAASFRILHLRTDTVVPVPVRTMTNGVLEAATQKSSPSLEAGQGRVAVTVSGVILLPEKDYPVR